MECDSRCLAFGPRLAILVSWTLAVIAEPISPGFDKVYHGASIACSCGGRGTPCNSTLHCDAGKQCEPFLTRSCCWAPGTPTYADASCATDYSETGDCTRYCCDKGMTCNRGCCHPDADGIPTTCGRSLVNGSDCCIRVGASFAEMIAQTCMDINAEVGTDCKEADHVACRVDMHCVGHEQPCPGPARQDRCQKECSDWRPDSEAISILYLLMMGVAFVSITLRSKYRSGGSRRQPPIGDLGVALQQDSITPEGTPRTISLQTPTAGPAGSQPDIEGAPAVSQNIVAVQD